MKARFLIKAKERGVITERGVRALIMERLLNSPFSRGAVLNVDDKTVEVRIEGDERRIKEFLRELQKALAAQFGNPAIIFTAPQEDDTMEIPKLMRSSQALMVGQLEKGINVQLEILSALKNMGAAISSLPHEIAASFKAGK